MPGQTDNYHAILYRATPLLDLISISTGKPKLIGQRCLSLKSVLRPLVGSPKVRVRKSAVHVLLAEPGFIRCSLGRTKGVHSGSTSAACTFSGIRRRIPIDSRNR